MRMLTQMSEQAGMQFSGYLAAKGIANQLERKEDGNVLIWVLNEDQIPIAAQELSVFQTNPQDPRFEAARHAGALLQERVQKQKNTRAKYVDVRQQWALGHTGPMRPAMITWVLIAICAIVFVGQNAQKKTNGQFEHWLHISAVKPQMKVKADPKTHQLELVPVPQPYTTKNFLPEVRHGQVWRMITPIFLHFSILHILFNMLWLKDLGRGVEILKGPWTLLAIVLVSAVLSNLAQYMVQIDITGPTFSLSPIFGGFSGVVYALFGYVWMKDKFYPTDGMRLSPMLVQMMIGWLVVCMVLDMNVANTAHLVGLLSGMAMGYFPPKIRKALRQR